MKNKFLKSIVFFLLLILIMIFNNRKTVVASTKLTGIENFPESYQSYLYELKSKHPNWEFTALYTGLDWEYVIQNEYKNDKNLVPISYSDTWKCTDEGIYNVEIDSGWVNSSKQAVEYTMDPRNFLNEVRIFQFEQLTYNEKTNTLEGIEKILYGTEFYNKKVSYKTSDGQTINTDKKYSDLIMEAAVYSGVSPYHLASRIKQEVGPFLSHNSISGTVEGYKGLYNFYNIGATSSTSTLGAIKNGLQYALDGKGSLSNIDFINQLLPWNSPEKSIKGGSVFIGKSYILVGQNNLYLQKFDVNDERSNEIFWHQYMTNCLAPYSESSSIYKAYNSIGLLDSSIGFVIPVYNNMPEYPTQSPDISYSDYEEDNTKVYANVSTTLNVRCGPGTSYEILTSISNDEIFTRIGRGIQNGERWDKVVLKNGMIGYVFQQYIQEASLEQIEGSVEVEEIIFDKVAVKLIKGKTITLNANVLPSNAVNQNLIWESKNDEIAKVTQDGLVTAISVGKTEIVVKNEDGTVQSSCIVEVVELNEEGFIEFDTSLKINGDEISGLDINNPTISTVKSKINTNYKLEFYNKDNELLDEDSFVGTGSKLVVKNDNDEEVYSYIFVIYGDLNGDGIINSVDVLVVQKYILELKTMTGVFLKAGNTAKNGNLPSALDVLKMQRHILEIKFIEQ